MKVALVKIKRAESWSIPHTGSSKKNTFCDINTSLRPLELSHKRFEKRVLLLFKKCFLDASLQLHKRVCLSVRMFDTAKEKSPKTGQRELSSRKHCSHYGTHLLARLNLFG